MSTAIETPRALSLNRCLSLNLIRERDTVVGLEVAAPVRGEGLRVTRVDAATQREVFDLLMSLRDAPRLSGLTMAADVAEQLCSAGVLMPRAELPRGVRYACFIDGHGSRPGATAVPDAPWIVNPSLRVLAGTGSFCAPWDDGSLAEAQALAWLVLPGSGVPFAYWLDAEDTQRLSRLATHRLMPAALDPVQRARYARAGLLTTVADVVRGRRCQHRRQRLRREHLAREGWVRLPGLLPRPLLASLQGYVAPLIGEGHLRFNDAQSRRYFQHGEALSVWLHQQLEPVLQDLVAEPIKRSYAFLGGYVGGSDLKRHTDREQCEYTLSLTLDAQPGPGRADAWPLGLVDRRGRERWARLAPGDALLFKGRELPHFRAPLAEGRRSTSAFLHFVPVDFGGRLD
jgi:hypothetical protein